MLLRLFEVFVQPQSLIECQKSNHSYAYSLTITKDEGIDTVSGAGNYVSGKTVTIVATLNSGYEFAGWVSNGDELTNSNSLTTTLTITQNTSVQATSSAEGEKELSLQYNGNGGTWNNPSHDTYVVNQDGYVVVRQTGVVYTIKYSPAVENIDLVDYNGAWFNWTSVNGEAGVPFGSEYYIVNASTNEKTYLDQSEHYSSIYLANAAGCDLLTTNCTVVAYVNWEEYLITNADYLKVSGTTSLALVLAMTLSSLFGTVVPIVLRKMKVDPAAASGPFITTLNDCIGVICYYGLALLMFMAILF